jgi:hypothetical protein
MKRLILVSACLMLFCWPGHDAAAEHRGSTESWRYGPMRRSYDAYWMTSYGTWVGIINQSSGYGNIGGRGEGPQTICIRGRVEDLPAADQAFWQDGETTYGPKWSGYRCNTSQ